MVAKEMITCVFNVIVISTDSIMTASKQLLTLYYYSLNYLFAYI
jgi:hypothetical protein